MEELRYVVPTDLNDDKGYYEIESHIHIPTYNYILRKTAVDVLRGVGDETEAKATVRYLAELSMNMLKSLIPPISRPMLEYLCAKDEEKRQAFLDVVCAVIATTRGKGLGELLNDGEFTQASLPKTVQMTAVGNGLLVKFYTRNLPQEWIRENY